MKRKSTIARVTSIVILSLLSTSQYHCQGVYTDWAHATSGTISTWGRCNVVDNSGNSVVAGIFFGPTDFDPGSGSLILDGGSDRDGFVSKYDASGNLLWAKQVISDNMIEIRSITKDASNNIIITGMYQGNLTFDVNQSSTSFTSVGSSDFFVAKYNTIGNVLWAYSFGASSEDESYSVNTDNLGNIYLTGYYRGTIDFDPGVAVFNMTSIGASSSNPNTFILKLNTSGQFVWAKQFTGGVNYSMSSTVSTNGDVFVGGAFNGTIDFDPGSGVNNLTDASPGNYEDFFICKLSSSGNFVWVKQMTNSDWSYIQSMELDFTGNLLFSGGYRGTLDFDPGPGTYELTSAGNYDIYVTKLDATGNFLWAKTTPGSGSDYCNSMCVSSNNSVYLGGYFTGTVDFDPGSSNYNVTSQQKDMFILKLDSNGEFLWVEIPEGTSYEEISSISMIPTVQDEIYFTGFFNSSIDMNGGPGQLILNSTAQNTAIVTGKFVPCTPLTSTVQVTTCEPYTWSVSGQTYSSSGMYTHTLESLNGCDSLVTLDLTIASISNGVTQNNNTLTANQSGANYTWVDCNNSNQPIAGATAQTYTATANGSYAVIVEQNGCTVTSNCVAITTVGLDDIKTDMFRVYPNPTSTMINVEMANASAVRLFDVSGKLLKELNGASFYTIDVTDLTPGMYMIESAEGAKAKFIKE